MDFPVDLRFLFPPLLNVIIFLVFLKSEGSTSNNVQESMQIIISILNMPFPFLILAVMLLLLFLFTPIRIPLNLNARRPILVRSGELSILLALSIVASIMFAPSLFWVLYCCLIALSPWYAMLWDLFKRFFNWFRHALTSIPPIAITYVIVNPNNSNQEEEELAQEPAAAHPQVELNTTIGIVQGDHSLELQEQAGLQIVVVA